MSAQPLSEKAIFEVACSIESVDSRNEYLNHVCGDDQLLRDRISTLLRMREEEPDFLKPQAILAPTLGFALIAEKPGMKIGRYKLVHEIGHGGMGVVYMAVQKEPVKRKVALKIIKPGMDTREVVTRFEGERQALALMDHQSIAKVLDGGSTESGRPYFVMELVDGTPITEFCDEARYNTRQRLELFGQVCQAAQHAHQKGIIHRDIKPSNILVTNFDHVAVPKVIDFGIAKAVHQPLTDQSVYTNVSQMIGTPLYMSPEQAQRSGLDIDTRTDVYSLGVLLYELLTGTTPFEKERLQNSSFDEVKRIIREEDPPRPSTRFSTLNAAQETVAEKHSTNLRALSHELSGELDWIVMKALEKYRARRYESANGLAKDVQRYLDDEPVEACPPSKVYRFRKFARRHRAILVSATAVLLSTMIVLVAVTLAAISRGQAANRQRELAEQRALVQGGINDALTEVARLRGQAQASGQKDQSALAQAREQAQRALALAEAGPVEPTLVAQVGQLAAELDQQQREGQLLAALDKAWLAKADMVGIYFNDQASLPVLREALKAYGIEPEKQSSEQCEVVFRSSSPAVQTHLLVAIYEWHTLLRPLYGINLRGVAGEIVVDSVVPQSTPARDGRIVAGDRIVGFNLGPTGPLVETSGMTYHEIDQILSRFSGVQARLHVIPKGKSDAEILGISRDPTFAWLESVLDAVDTDPWRQRLRAVDHVEDVVQRREALEKLAKEADVASQPVRVLVRLAKHLRGVNAQQAALQLLHRVWQRHANDVQANLQLAMLLKSCMQLDEAIRYNTAAVALRPDSHGLRINLGVALQTQGKYEEAVVQYREALRIQPDIAIAHLNLGWALAEQGRFEEAIAKYREALRLDPERADSHSNLGVALRATGKLKEAVAAYREAIRIAPNRAFTHRNLGNALLEQGNREEAIAEYREAIRIDPDDGTARNNLEIALKGQGRIEKALAAYRETPNNVLVLINRGLALERAGRLDDAMVEYDKALLIAPENAVLHMNRGVIFFKTKRADDAIAEFQKALQIQPDLTRAQELLYGAFSRYRRWPEAISFYREDVRLRSNNPFSQVCLAMLLSVDAPPQLQQPEQAVAHAMKAVELEPQNASNWFVLGKARCRDSNWTPAVEALAKAVELEPKNGGYWLELGKAHYRSGQWKEAIQSQMKDVELRSGGTASGWLFLAMAHWQLDQKEDARRWYDKATKWMNENETNDAELARFRLEAAELLGIEESSGEKMKPEKKADGDEIK